MSSNKNLTAMSDFRKFVTPSTAGIIWLAKEGELSDSPYYSDVDYLVDGLLTQNINSTPQLSSRTLVAESFGKKLIVLIVQRINESEIESFLNLFPDLSSENDFVLIDESDNISKIKSKLSALESRLRIL